MPHAVLRALYAGSIAVIVLYGGFVAPPALAVDIRSVTSPKGIVAWLVHDPAVPVISMSFAFDAGAAHDPAGKEGRAQMTASLLDEGAGELDSQAFQRRLEDIAMSLRFSATRDSFRGTIRTLSANRDAAFAMLALALTRPRFDAEPVERIRAQTLSALDDDEEEPQTIASRTWFNAVFPGHPYGRPVSGTPQSVKTVAVADLRQFVRDYLTRDRLKIGVVGDIAPDELARRLDEIFGGLPATGSSARVPDIKPAAAGRVIVVERAIPQSVVTFGQTAVGRKDPDWYAAYIMNRVLGGGGFSSRLTEEIREKRGLAYSVYSYLIPLDHAPLIVGGVATANERVAESLRLIRGEWRRMAEHGLTEKELDVAKTYINGSFPLRFDSSRRIADVLVSIQMDNLGIDYIDRRPRLINAVTLADIRRVARRILRADRLTVVVVGKPVGIISNVP
jgi:zinc protease